ncbi:MAG: hydrogenase maturation protease [bacterium]
MKMKYLVLGLGNDLLGDDAVGPLVARRLANIDGAGVTVMESAESGVTLLDIFVGFDRALIVDGMITGVRPVGAVSELQLGDLRTTPGPSPHYSGLPEMVQLAAKLQLKFPREFRILAVELEDVHTVGGCMSPPVSETIPLVVQRVREIITEWHLQDRMRCEAPASRRVANA